ncbi:location of vulva defective 1 isoform X3 [Poecilia reticulata]|uniref:location of vulva defective 1 isoform X3 n=1 Tax=Poecilia reticulata TaxID=8081 RepID=UPI0004A3A718|nr:PREDICTED: location of vulva defective 1-like isoform X3 [Poecilia reticulata]
MKPLKITASLLLLLQAFHLVCLQNSTDSPGRTIDKTWLRQLPRNEVQSENAASSGDGGFDQGTDQVTAFNNGLSSGIASGFMAEEEENMTSQDKSANSSDVSTIMPHAFENETAEEPKLPDAAISPRNVTTSANSSQTNMMDPEEEFNSTTTSARGLSNNPNLQSTTTTEKPATTTTTTVTPEKDERLRNLTENTNTSVTTTASPEMNGSTTVTTAAPEIQGSTTVTTAAPEIKGSTTKSSTTTEPPYETTQTRSESTTTAVLDTPESANKKIGIGSDRGSATDTGSVVDPYRSKRSVAWLAVLGTAAVTAVVGLVAYIILKKKHQKAFTHRKLVEEYPSDPVLRLDNGEPLDLNYGSYYNPGLQGDSIQMTNIPGRR